MALGAFRILILIAFLWRISQTRVVQDPNRGGPGPGTFGNRPTTNPTTATIPPTKTSQPTVTTSEKDSETVTTPSPATTSQPAVTSNGDSDKDSKESEINFIKSPADIDTTVGMQITLHCKVTGKHQPTISWTKDNKSLESDHVIVRKEFIRIRSVVATDQGIYTCIARNNIGTVATRDAKVTITTVDLPTCGQRKSQSTKAKRIIGGNNATTHWPWQVLIEYRKNRDTLCGGSLISKRWVLTAAHCTHSRMFWYTTREFRLRVGVYNRSEFNLKQQILKIDRIITHPKYQWDNPSYDIALLHLENAARMTDEVGTICLPESSGSVSAGTKCVTTGWGRTKLGVSQLPELLQEVVVPVVSRRQCNKPESYNKSLPKNTLCAGYDEGGKDACHNDSGGPLACYDHNKWVLQGITNSGIACALPHKYGVYAQVSKYVQWITKQINEKS